MDNVEPVTEQFPESTTYDTAPEPEPPEVVSDKVEPYVPDVDVTVSADCETLAIVTAVDVEDTEL